MLANGNRIPLIVASAHRGSSFAVSNRRTASAFSASDSGSPAIITSAAAKSPGPFAPVGSGFASGVGGAAFNGLRRVFSGWLVQTLVQTAEPSPQLLTGSHLEPCLARLWFWMSPVRIRLATPRKPCPQFLRARLFLSNFTLDGAVHIPLMRPCVERGSDAIK